MKDPLKKSGIEYDHESLDIRKKDDQVFLINYGESEHKPKIIWILPEYVKTFLYPDVMGITSLNGQIYIVQTCGDSLSWKTPVTLLTDNHGRGQEVTSHIDKDQLEKSYFRKMGSKFYFHKCIIRKRDNKLVISSPLMDKDGNLECQNVECVLGYAPMPDLYD